VWSILTLAITSFITWLELDNALRSVDSKVNSKVRNKIRTYIVIFIGTNCVLALLIYFLFVDNPSLSSWPPVWRATFLGLLYPALIRFKFATIRIEGTDLPVGLDLYYEKIRKAFYRRVDSLLGEDEFDRVKEFAETHEFEELIRRAKITLTSAIAFSNEEKDDLREWIARLENDQNTPDIDKKLYISQYILFGRTNKL